MNQISAVVFVVVVVVDGSDVVAVAVVVVVCCFFPIRPPLECGNCICSQSCMCMHR